MSWLRSAFQDELDGVTAALVELSAIVSSAIDKATHALLTADLAEAEEVITADDRVDNLQHDRCAHHRHYRPPTTCCI